MGALPDIDQGHVEGFFTGALLKALGPDMLRQVLAEFRIGREMEKIQMRIRQKQVGAEENRTAHRTIEGIGQLRMRVDLGAYLWWKLNRPGCWKDKQFRDEFHRDNPEVRVNTIKKATVIAPGKIELAGKYAPARQKPEASGTRNTEHGTRREVLAA